MRNEPLKKLGKSVLRIVAALAVILGIPAVAYLLWQPGGGEPLPPYSGNAIWIGHGWLGDDAWFSRNRRNKADFRTDEKISALFSRLKAQQDYGSLCLAQANNMDCV